MATMNSPTANSPTVIKPVVIKPPASKGPTVTLTQIFGPTHKAVDLAVPANNPIFAPESFRVTRLGFDPDGYGYYVMGETPSGNKLTFGHLNSIGVLGGQIVAPGGVIGLEGSTGNSTGPHLHFETIVGGSYVDPYSIYGPGLADILFGGSASQVQVRNLLNSVSAPPSRAVIPNNIISPPTRPPSPGSPPVSRREIISPTTRPGAADPLFLRPALPPGAERTAPEIIPFLQESLGATAEYLTSDDFKYNSGFALSGVGLVVFSLILILGLFLYQNRDEVGKFAGDAAKLALL